MGGMPAPAGGMGAWAGAPSSGPSAADPLPRPPRVSGKLLPCDSQVLAVHAALMHTGKVLFFAGSGELHPDKEAAHHFEASCGTTKRRLLPASHAHRLFCGGQSFLPDGRLLVAGGTKQYDGPFEGLRDASPSTPPPLTGSAYRTWPAALVPHPGSLGNGTVLAVVRPHGNGP